MRRWIAILWHASFLVLAGGLYFFFVLPRWYELLGEWSPTLGSSMRIACGVLIGLAALPIVFIWLRTRRPEYGTPRLALSLRVAAIALQVLAGVLIVGAAVSEFWLSLDDAGQYLFGVYGAAAALTLLGAFSFYLAFAAELPPPPPKPLRPKGEGRRRGRKTAEPEPDPATRSRLAPLPAEDTDEDTDEPVTSTDDADADQPTEVTTNTAGNAEASEVDELTEEKDSEDQAKLRNRRPGGKSSSRLFRRTRGGVALDD